MKKSWLAAVGVGVVALGVGVYVVVSDGPADVEVCDTGAGLVSTSESSDGGELIVDEFGFDIHEKADGRTTVMFVGVLVRNTSADVASDIAFQINVVDSDGESVIHSDVDKYNKDNTEIGVLFPGATAGSGDWKYTYAHDVQPENWPIDFDAVDVTITVTSVTWWPAEAMGTRYPEVTARITDMNDYEVLVVPNISTLGSTLTTVEIEHDACADLHRFSQSFLLRNAEGEIIGGTNHPFEDKPGSVSSPRLYRIWTPIDVDIERSQVWIYADALGS